MGPLFFGHFRIKDLDNVDRERVSSQNKMEL